MVIYNTDDEIEQASVVDDSDEYILETEEFNTSDSEYEDDAVNQNEPAQQNYQDERKGRPKKGRKRKYPEQSRQIRKKIATVTSLIIQQKEKRKLLEYLQISTAIV